MEFCQSTVGYLSIEFSVGSNLRDRAYNKLKNELVTTLALDYLYQKIMCYLNTNASAVGVGAVHSQLQNSNERMIAYFSKTPSPTQQNCCVTMKEPYAVVKAVKSFRPYLYSQKFVLHTHHTSLHRLYAK